MSITEFNFDHSSNSFHKALGIPESYEKIIKDKLYKAHKLTEEIEGTKSQALENVYNLLTKEELAVALIQVMAQNAQNQENMLEHPKRFGIKIEGENLDEAMEKAKDFIKKTFQKDVKEEKSEKNLMDYLRTKLK